MAKNLRIAYLITAYKLPDQLIELVESLECEEDYFLIHIDKKAKNDVFAKVQKALNKYQNVVFLSRHQCNWGDFGHVRATLKGMRYLHEQSLEYTNFVVITGQDLPLHPTKTTRTLIASAGNSMEFFELPAKHWGNGGLDRLKLYHYWLAQRYFVQKVPGRSMRMERLLEETMTETKTPCYYGGSSYFQLEKSAVEYVLSFLDSHRKYISFFKHSFISDEIFFQTILLNSSLANKIKNNPMRYIDWTDPHESPKILRMEDLPKIRAAKAIFARKFDASVDPKVINHVLGRGKK